MARRARTRASAVAEKDSGGGRVGRREALLLGSAWVARPGEGRAAGEREKRSYQEDAMRLVEKLEGSLERAEEGSEASRKKEAEKAKGEVQSFLARWQGEERVRQLDSYRAIEDALRTLALYYARYGGRAKLSEEAQESALTSLEAARAALSSSPPR